MDSITLQSHSLKGWWSYFEITERNSEFKRHLVSSCWSLVEEFKWIIMQLAMINILRWGYTHASCPVGSVIEILLAFPSWPKYISIYPYLSIQSNSNWIIEVTHLLDRKLHLILAGESYIYIEIRLRSLMSSRIPPGHTSGFWYQNKTEWTNIEVPDLKATQL